MTRTGQAGADDVGNVDAGRPPAPARGAQGAERGPVTSSAQKEATAHARYGRREHGGRGKAGRTAKQEAATKADSPGDQRAGPGQEPGESWEERVARFDELESAKLDEMLDKREDATLDKMLDKREDATLDAMLDAREEARFEWYKKVGIHREFARDYARRAARMSC